MSVLLAQQLCVEALRLNLVGGVVSRLEVEGALGLLMDRKMEAANKTAPGRSRDSPVVPRTVAGSTVVVVASQNRTECGEAPAVVMQEDNTAGAEAAGPGAVNKGRLRVGAAGRVLHQEQQTENVAVAGNKSEGAASAGLVDDLAGLVAAGNPGSDSNSNPAAAVNWRCGCWSWRGWC